MSKIFTKIVLIFPLAFALFAQQMTIEYGSTFFDDGVLTGAAFEAGIAYNFGGSTYYLEDLKAALDSPENNVVWKVVGWASTTPNRTVIGSLSGTFNVTIGDDWQTHTIDNGTAMTGKVTFLIGITVINGVYIDTDSDNADGEWVWYNNNWYESSSLGGGVHAIKAIVNTVNPTPVELLTFEGNYIDGKVALNWSTATEVNNYGFEIERNIPLETIDTENLTIKNPVKYETWEKVGFVEGNGNSNSPKSYNFEDKTAGQGKYVYRLKQVDTDGTYEYSGIVTVETVVVDGYALQQNFPNPFNPTTKIKFSIPESGNVTLKVFNALGQEVATLINGEMEAGNYEKDFVASNIPSGVYFYQLEAGGKFMQQKKMILIK